MGALHSSLVVLCPQDFIKCHFLMGVCDFWHHHSPWALLLLAGFIWGLNVASGDLPVLVEADSSCVEIAVWIEAAPSGVAVDIQARYGVPLILGKLCPASLDHPILLLFHVPDKLSYFPERLHARDAALFAVAVGVVV